MSANMLYSGGFDGRIDGRYWTGGAFSRSLGYPRLGCAHIAAGDSMWQDVQLSGGQPYTLYLFYRLAAGATLTITLGSAWSETLTGSPHLVWREACYPVAFDGYTGTSLQFAASGGSAYVDSVALLLGALPATRAGLATSVAGRLATLVGDAGWSSTPDVSGPEGDYSDAVDEALRAAGAVNTWGDPDVTELEPGEVNGCLASMQTAVLTRLRALYALRVDVSLGPRRESLSQIADSIDKLLGAGSGGGASKRAGTGRLHRAGGWER